MDLLSVLNTTFVICLAMTILFFVISVILFFLFDIKTIYMIRSGRAQAKTVKEMEEINSSTGRLRGSSNSHDKDHKKKNKKAPVILPQTETQAQPDPAGYAEGTELLNDESETTEKLSASANTQAHNSFSFDGSSQTTVLAQEAETSVLDIETETTVLGQQTQAQPSFDNGTEVVATFFDVVKKIIISDTNEVIR